MGVSAKTGAHPDKTTISKPAISFFIFPPSKVWTNALDVLCQLFHNGPIHRIIIRPTTEHTAAFYLGSLVISALLDLEAFLSRLIKITLKVTPAFVTHDLVNRFHNPSLSNGC